ncbi:MAG TPA: carboxypeptidase-like regulatory domain-containing protein [Thermoanaerobaculia bacterium]|nr:carboxypeptidase-like regulatory domain-containing protein [Thermoanaerobaculia bacterium]
MRTSKSHGWSSFRSLSPALLLGLCIAGFFGWLGAGRQRPDTPSRQHAAKKYVAGYLVARLGGQGTVTTAAPRATKEIFLPGIDVALVDPATNQAIDKTVTDLSGRFHFPPQKSGSYKLCWQGRGWADDCLPKPIQVGSRPVQVGVIPIRPRADGDRQTSIFGEVQLRDGESTRTLEPVAGVNRFATVSAVDQAGKRLYEVPVNNFGEYVIPAVPAVKDGHLQLVAEVEKGRTVRSIRGEKLTRGPVQRVDITLRNSAPRIDELVATVAGRQTRTAEPGDEVELTVQAADRDGDPVKLLWSLPAGGGTLSSGTGSPVRWKLPAAPGAYAITLLAGDGKGGYDRAGLSLAVGAKGVAFSGRITDLAGQPLEKVAVEVGGRSAATDAGGFFRLEVPRDRRYVLNARRSGYALLSHVYDAGVSGGRWRMSPVRTVKVDPAFEIRVEDTSRKEAGCTLPASTRIDWKTFGKRQVPRRQDGRGNTLGLDEKAQRSAIPPTVIRLRSQRQCGPGTQVVIPANGLVDAGGNPPPPGTQVEVSVGTVDLLDPDSMPGDYSARTTGNQEAWMVSYGAGSVEIEAGGKSYNLRPGVTARLRIPVADVQLAAGGAIPPTVPRLVYDPKTGLWNEEGVLKLDPTGRFYEADVKHFSTINADVLKQGQSCVRFKSEDLPTPFRLEVVVPLGAGQAPRVRDVQIDENEIYWAIVNLPNNTDITLTAYQPQGAGGIPYGVYTVNTGGAQTGTPTAPNYFECQTKVVLREVEAPDPGPDAFLHGLYSFFATQVNEINGQVDLADPLVQATIAYYGTTDPRGLRKTFDEFKDANGFAPAGDPALKAVYGPVDEVRAAYANSVDLGFGRDMHGKRTLADDGQWDIAFYVSNYGFYDTDDEGDFENAVNQVGSELVATVAMEWSRIEDGPAIPFNPYDPNAGADPNDPNDPVSISDNERVIKFYVYNAAGDPVFAANLDGRGTRPIPQLCMVCHGGVYPGGNNTGTPTFAAPADVKLGSVMLPFDLHGYVLTGGVPAAFSKANQQLEFSELNEMVVDTEPGEAVVEIIDEMYNGVSVVQEEDFVVTGWDLNAAHRDAYLNVMKPACRTCHAARPLEDDGLGGERDIRFSSIDEWLLPTHQVAQLASLRVCTQRVMPHAFATYNRFWGSFDVNQPAIFPFQVSRFKAFFDGVVEPALASQGTNVQLGNDCVTPADLDEDFVEPPVTLSLIQSEILDNNCGVCHASPPNFTNVTVDLSSAAQTHATTVGVNAQELTNGGDRVAAGASGSSYLINKVQANLAGLPCTNFPGADARDNCGTPMPPPAGGLSVDDIADLVEWIDAGAANN